MLEIWFYKNKIHVLSFYWNLDRQFQVDGQFQVDRQFQVDGQFQVVA
jgi:hypothetical protein